MTRLEAQCGIFNLLVSLAVIRRFRLQHTLDGRGHIRKLAPCFAIQILRIRELTAQLLQAGLEGVSWHRRESYHVCRAPQAWASTRVPVTPRLAEPSSQR